MTDIMKLVLNPSFVCVILGFILTMAVFIVDFDPSLPVGDGFF